MAQSKSTAKTNNSPSSRVKKENPVTVATEAKKMMEGNDMSFPPDLVQIAMQQISDSRVRSAANMAKVQELETKKELDKLQSNGGSQQSPTPAPMWGMPAAQPQGSNPILAMLNQLPEEERSEFIKENKESLIGGLMGGAPGNQFLQRMMNTGGDKQPGMGEMAQMMLAMTAAQSEQQKNMLAMWMNLQQVTQTQRPPENGNEKILQALMQVTQAISADTRQREAALQEKLLQAAEKQMELERAHAEERAQMMQQMFEKQVQTMQQANQTRPDALTRNDLPAILAQIKEVTGVELKPDQNAEVLRARYEHEREMKALEIQEEAAKRQQDMAMAAHQAESQKWNALGSMMTPMVDAMRMKSKMAKGGSATAKNIKRKAIS